MISKQQKKSNHRRFTAPPSKKVPKKASSKVLIKKTRSNSTSSHSSKRLISPNSKEVNRIMRRVSGFDMEHSHAWQFLLAKFGPKLNREELVSIAELISEKIQIHIDRDARRRKIVLIKWFEENWTLIFPFIQIISLAHND